MDMGPCSREVLSDINYLLDVDCIVEETKSMEKGDLLIYKITEKGKELWKKLPSREEYLSRINLLLEIYGYKKLDELLDYVHSKYTEEVYAPSFEELIKVMKIDTNLARLFWEKIAEEYEEATPFWYLASLLNDILSQKLPSDRAFKDILFELYTFLMDYSKRSSIHLQKDKTLSIKKSLQKFVYDKCYVLLQQANESGISIESE